MQYTPKKKKMKDAKDSLPRVNITVDSLPSKSLPYGKGAEIRYRGYTFGEIKSSNQSKLGPKDLFRTVLSGIETSFTKEMITVQDCLFLGFLRKISTVGSTDISIEVGCPKCDARTTFALDLSKDIEFEDIKAPKLPVIAPLKAGDMAFTPINVNDVYNLIDSKKETDEIAMVAAQCRSHSFDEAYQMIYNCDADDAEILAEVDKFMHHSLLPMKKKCGGCSNELEISLDIGGKDQNLVLPFRGRKRDGGNRIRFGS